MINIDEGYIRLYIAIFKQALNEDTMKGCYDFEDKVICEIENTYGRVNRKLVEELFKSKYKKKLKELIKVKIYDETMAWPSRNLKKEHEYRDKKKKLERECINEYMERYTHETSSIFG